MTSTAHGAIYTSATAAPDDCLSGPRRPLVELLVTAAALPADREWINLTAGMYSLLAWVEPLAILRDIAQMAEPSTGEAAGLCAAS